MSVADDPIWGAVTEGKVVRPSFRRKSPDAERESTNDVEDRAKELGLTRRTAEIDPILCAAGAVDMQATVAEDALIRADAPIFQRGGGLVRPCKREMPGDRGQTVIAAGVIDVGITAVVDELTRAVEFQKFDQRCKSWVVCDTPPQIAATILSRAGEWRLRTLAGVISTPTIRPDGTLLTAPGYDPATRLFHIADASLKLPAIVPSKEAAKKALAELIGLLAGFPFVSYLDQSVALSALLTPVCRGAMPVAPMHVVRAPAAGSGKSYVADLASVIATGRRCPVVPPSIKPEEADKKLEGLLLSGCAIISLDNINGELGGDLLCQAVERRFVEIRIFGTQVMREVENRTCIFANGNGIRIRADMVRRTLIANLDSGLERPEKRKFGFDPVASVEADRGRYVAACLTIVQSYMLSPDRADLVPLVSFEGWTDTVRGALVWLGQPDPCDSQEDVREGDPDLDDLRQLMRAWVDLFGIDSHVTTAEACRLAITPLSSTMGVVHGEWEHTPLREAILAVGASKGVPSARNLSRYLSSRAGRICDQMRFKKGKEDGNGYVQWILGRA